MLTNILVYIIIFGGLFAIGFYLLYCAFIWLALIAYPFVATWNFVTRIFGKTCNELYRETAEERRERKNLEKYILYEDFMNNH